MTKNQKIQEIVDCFISNTSLSLSLMEPENYPVDKFYMLNLANQDWYVEFLTETRDPPFRTTLEEHRDKVYDDFTKGKDSASAWVLATVVIAATMYEEQRAKYASTENLENLDCSIFE